MHNRLMVTKAETALDMILQALAVKALVMSFIVAAIKICRCISRMLQSGCRERSKLAVDADCPKI